MLSTPGGSGIPAKKPVFQRSPSQKYRKGIVVLQMDEEFFDYEYGIFALV